MNAYTGIERRKHKRINKQIPLNITGFNNKKTLPKFDEEIALNISETGILIECSKPLPIATSLNLKIMLNLDSGYKTIETTSAIMWTKESHRKTYYFGCRFMELSEEDKTSLKDFASLQ